MGASFLSLPDRPIADTERIFHPPPCPVPLRFLGLWAQGAIALQRRAALFPWNELGMQTARKAVCITQPRLRPQFEIETPVRLLERLVFLSPILPGARALGFC